MANIAKLSSSLSGNTSIAASTINARLMANKGYEVLNKRLQSIENTANSTQRSLGRLFKILAGVAIIAFIRNVVNSAVETLRFSRAIDESYHNVLAFRAALQLTGVQASEADKALGDMVKSIADALNGNVALRDSFKRLGGDTFLDDIAKLNPVAQFDAIADAISKISDPLRRAALASQIFGDNAEAVIAVLSKGNGAIAAQTQKVQAFGYTFKTLDVSQLEAASISLDGLQATFERFVLMLAVRVVPYINKWLDSLDKFSTSTGPQATSTVSTLGKAIAYLGVVLNNMIVVVQVALQGALQGIRGIGAAILWVVIKTQDGILYMLKNSGLASAELIATMEKGQQKTKEWRVDLVNAIKAGNSELDRLFDQFQSFEDADKHFDDVADAAKKSAKAIDDTARAGGALNQIFKNGEFFKNKIGQIVTENQTPLEKFNNTMVELNAMLATDAKLWDTYARAVGKAVEELENAHSLNNLSLSQNLQGGTSEAVSTFNRAKFENERRGKEKPADRMERIAQEALAIETTQAGYLKSLAEAAKNRKVVTIPK